ncbi:hypothetical protein ACFQZX_18575 [Mucilaginibacter litoreus]|uniref:Uncharacterized protein n=1 Tax=Mucilaginibacter litoreus TaxID=1048221 RepID=A0ABW3AZ61_9SPHI
MKISNILKPALAYLITGLMITILTPIISRQFSLPDYLRGFLTGLGLTLEFIALVKIQPAKKHSKCPLRINASGKR